MNRLLFVALLILSNAAIAQVNYVHNPSFEKYKQCPDAYDQIVFANSWSSIDSNYSSDGCWPEYLNACGIGSCRVPNNFSFWQYPRTGTGMSQIQVFYDEIIQPPPQNLRRDYLQGRLYKKLTAGKQYCVTFWVCAEEGSSFAIKEISAYLDDGTIDTTKTCGQPQTKYTPQVTNTGGIITDTMRWTKIEGAFIANGTERFITIGNFRSKANTTWVYTPVDQSQLYDSTSYGWYLIDDVSVIESATRADAGRDTHVGIGDSVFIGRPVEIGLECTWTKLGSTTIIGTGAGLFVKPTITTSYVVTQTLCGMITKDTVKVEVWKLGVGGVNNGQSQAYTLSPNPSSGAFTISQTLKCDEAVTAGMYNVIGQKVWSSIVTFRGGKASAVVHERLPPGTYYLHLKDRYRNTTVLRFLKQ